MTKICSIEIRPRGLEWEVFLKGKLQGVFFPQDDALLYACQLAQDQGAEVRVFDVSGRLSVIIHRNTATERCASNWDQVAATAAS